MAGVKHTPRIKKGVFNSVVIIRMGGCCQHSTHRPLKTNQSGRITTGSEQGELNPPTGNNESAWANNKDF